MKPYLHLSLSIAEFFLEWEMIRTEVLEKLKNTRYIQYLFAENPAIYEINVEKYGRSTRATCGNIIWRMRGASWKTRTKDTYA